MLALLLGASLEARAAHAASTQKRIYIANDDHTDYMWTGTDVEYRTAFQNMLNFYMAQAEATAGNAPNARGRFNCDGSLWVWEYERNRPAADFDRLIGHLRDGTITMPLQGAVLLYGAMPAEAVLRDMYYAGRLERRYGLRFPLVMGMENQTLPGGVASLWAGAGAEYSWRGICGCATKINAKDRPREIYQFTGPDGASVCMKWNSMKNGPASIGGYAEAKSTAPVVDYVDEDPGYLSRWPWGISAAFGYGADSLQTTTNAFINAAINESDGDREVWVSNTLDFFQEFVPTHGAEIPVFSGSFGNEWDLYTASMGEVTADFKRHVEKLRTAEALATVASLQDPSFMNGREAWRDSAFLACGLYYEHDWTADGHVSKASRATWERRMRDTFVRYVDRLYGDGLSALASRVAAPGGVERHVVFNPLSWTRDDFADLVTSVASPRHVVDVITGADVPSQTVTVNGVTYLRIRASDVPSVGYRVYEVRSGAGTSFPSASTVTLPAMDNGRYRVQLASDGSIVSLIDHADGNRELVDVANGGSIHDLGTGSGSVTLESNGPVSTTLKVVASGSPDHTSRVTLYAGSSRIDLEGLVTENFSSTVSYRSSFDLAGATMRHEEVGMIARVARTAQGGDYADQNARTDYLTFNHFVDLSTATRGVTISNWDSPFFAPGTSTVTTLNASPIIKAVVGMQVDGTTFGILNQGGDTQFLDRFALETHGAYDPATAMRFSLEHQNPLVAARVTGGPSAPLPQTQWSMLTIDSPDVLLWALKPAEEGIDHGVVARVWNLADTPKSFQLSLPQGGVQSAQRTTHLETDLGPATIAQGALTGQLQRQQMATYRLNASGSLAADPAPAAGLAIACAPNPARGAGATTIFYALPEAGHVRVMIHDVRGARVVALGDGPEAAGRHTLHWNGRAQSGAPVAPGVYFVRIEAAGQARSERIVRLE